MEMVATVALKPGMELAENVTDHRGNVILKKHTILDRNYIEKLSVHNIICVNILEPEDYVDNYFDIATRAIKEMYNQGYINNVK